jgi:hypothetical protein
MAFCATVPRSAAAATEAAKPKPSKARPTAVLRLLELRCFTESDPFGELLPY